MNTKESALEFIEQTEAMLADTDHFGSLLKDLKSRWGDVNNYASFRKFFENFLKDCPNQEIVKSCNVEQEATELWSQIDVNKNGNLDENEEKLVVQHIIKHSLYLTKKYFNI